VFVTGNTGHICKKRSEENIKKRESVIKIKNCLQTLDKNVHLPYVMLECRGLTCKLPPHWAAGDSGM